ncbi:MAG: 3-hydroxybutyryl-CoA dehydrogenase [Alphaproteobacteria bacterium]|nr:3-hydroxybutyryl-CoA dehydrogenase [Alphaproteobacteria bacterium]
MSGPPVIGVAGLGAMGLGIAQLFAQAGHPVVATDSQASARESALPRLASQLDARVAQGKLSAAERGQILSRVTIADDLAAFAPAALVIEAIIEQLQAKQALFAALENVVGQTCVLASNTSSLSISAITQNLRHRERGLGLHFFNPVPSMKLVELVATAATSNNALQTARSFTEAAGKTVISCADTPGFIVNRCARPFYGEALALLEEGRSASDIDAAMLQAGYRIGPLSLIDLVGADINLAATQSLSAAMEDHPRYHVFDVLKAQVASGRLGRKTGQGFLFPARPGPPPADAASIAARIEATLANEAASLLGQGGLAMDEIDTALKLGLNFPRGPFEAARAQGFAAIRATLAALEVAAPQHLKGRYAVTAGLEHLS